MGVRPTAEVACSTAKDAALACASTPAPDGPEDRRPRKAKRCCPSAAQREWRRRRKHSADGRHERRELIDRAKRPGDRRVDRATRRRFRRYGLRWDGRRAQFGRIASVTFSEAAESRSKTPAASRAASPPPAPPAATSAPAQAASSASSATAAPASSASSASSAAPAQAASSAPAATP
jgi:hypothetical protein